MSFTGEKQLLRQRIRIGKRNFLSFLLIVGKCQRNMVLLTAEQASGLSGYRIFTRPAQADALPDSASETSQAPQLYLCTQNPAQALTQLQAEGDNLLLLRETSPVS